MNIEDTKLLGIYMNGFTDELDGKSRQIFQDNLSQIAYNIGALDAFAGDTLSAIDSQTNNEIINHIRTAFSKI